jgi:GNAT superfamily N-acetyltransferase
MKSIIQKATHYDSSVVADLVYELLKDFNSTGNSNFDVDLKKLNEVTTLLLSRNNYAAFIAYNEQMLPIGLITISQASAIYNFGDFGVINELFVNKNQRSVGIGKLLINFAIAFSKEQGWKKIEVGAPNASNWPRTIEFYKKIIF